MRPHDRTVLARRRFDGASSPRPSFHSARPFDRPSSPPPSFHCAHRFIFSALTIPLPRFPPRSRPPDARAHPPRPMSAFSARVNIAPSESPARECPDGPSPSARPAPPSKRYITPPSTRVTRLLEGRVCDRPACAVTPRLDIFFPSRSESSLGGTTRDGAVEGPVRSASRAVDRSFRRRTDADRGRPEPPGAETDTDPSDEGFSRNEPIKSAPRPFTDPPVPPPSHPAPSLQSSRGVRPRPTPAAAPRSPPRPPG